MPNLLIQLEVVGVMMAGCQCYEAQHVLNPPRATLAALLTTVLGLHHQLVGSGLLSTRQECLHPDPSSSSSLQHRIDSSSSSEALSLNLNKKQESYVDQ